MELYRLLKESGKNRSQALEIQKALVKRAKASGRTTAEIINTLVAGVGKKRDRSAIANEWCEAVGISAKEFRRLADS